MDPIQFPQNIPEILREAGTRWWERAQVSPTLCETYSSLSEARREELVRVVAASEFAVSVLIQDPEALTWADEHWMPDSASDANAEYERLAVSAVSVADAQQILRRWRRREMLRLAWRDIVAAASVPETLRDVSLLADRCIRAASEAAHRHLGRTFGVPRTAAGDASELVVLGMGKLGGRELNFSSDVDLVFLFEGAGETDGPRSIDNQDYFTRLGRELIRLLDARTEDGFVFRVDMRLRPFGDSGPLVVSLASLEDYLHQPGRDWERYAWIKARAVVGESVYEAANREFVRPFVYRRYLDFGVFESLREMKTLIAREVTRRDLEQDLKLGMGGIREIEFIAQSMQLVRGGGDRRLQNPALLEVMPMLVGSKLLTSEEVARLTGAYLTLRKAENALQMIRDEQAHALPEDPVDRARLCVNMGAEDWATALARIDAARCEVAQQFEALLSGGPDPQRRNGESTLGWLDAEGVDIGEELSKRGFPTLAISAVAKDLETYRRAAPYRRLDEARRRRVRVIVDRLLEAAARQPAPAVVVQRVLRVLDAIGARSSYLALLKEQPPALDRLIDVCAISGFLARQIADFPLLLDELIDPNAV